MTGKIEIYKTPDNLTEVEVQFDKETVWLNQYQLAELFDTDRTSILKHIQNIYPNEELHENSTCVKIAQVRQEGKRNVSRNIIHYNLDMKKRDTACFQIRSANSADFPKTGIS